MSWNTSRILNDLEYEINENKQDISMLEQKTLYISDQLSLTGTVFLNNVYSDAFVKNGGTATQYLMADGSTTTNSQQGQPNIYLYNNNNSGTPEPTSGQIRANDPNNQNVTELYISHITSDGIDIDVFLQQISTISVIYLQDRNNSNNNVRFNVTGAIINNPNLYVTVPVIFDIAQGTGSIDFGDGHPLFMSIFDNSQLIDSRISAVENKTQHQSATSLETRFNSPINMFDHKIYNVADPVDLNDVSNKNYVDTSISAIDLSSYTPLSDFNDLNSTVITQGQYIIGLEVVTQNISATSSMNTVNRSLNLLIDSSDFFAIRSLDSLTNYLILTPTNIQLYRNINMNASEISNLSGIKIGSGNDNFFVKSNGTTDSNIYLTSSSSDITTLQTKTQNITATANETVLSKYTKVILREAEPDFFLVQGDGNDLKFVVGRTSITCGEVLVMNNNKITSLGTPTLDADGVTKLYTDTADNLKLDKTGGTISGNVIANNFIKSGGLVTQFLKADGSSDANTYLTTSSASTTYATISNLNTTNTNVTALQTKTQNLTATNSLNTLTQSLLLNLNIATAQSFQIRDTATNLMYTFSDSAMVLYRQLNLNNQNIINGANITASSFIKTGGLTTQFLKANGDSDASTYLKADGTVAMTGALNMGNQNITAAGSVTATSFVKTAGTATQYLLANGTVDSRSMITTQVIQVSNLTSSGITEFNMTPTATIGSWAWTDGAIGYTRQVTIHGLLNRTNNTATTWSLRIKTNDIENAIIAFPASPNTIVANVPWTMYITWTRYLTAALMWNIRWESAEATTAGYWRTVTQNAGGSVVALGVLAAYTLTMQSNVATSTLNVVHANVQNVYTG